MTEPVYWTALWMSTANVIENWDDRLSMLADVHVWRTDPTFDLSDLILSGSDENGYPVEEFIAKDAPPPFVITSGHQFLA